MINKEKWSNNKIKKTEKINLKNILIRKLVFKNKQVKKTMCPHDLYIK